MKSVGLFDFFYNIIDTGQVLFRERPLLDDHPDGNKVRNGEFFLDLVVENPGRFVGFEHILRVSVDFDFGQLGGKEGSNQHHSDNNRPRMFD